VGRTYLSSCSKCSLTLSMLLAIQALAQMQQANPPAPNGHPDSMGQTVVKSSPADPPAEPKPHSPIEVLSDTQGVDFSHYLRDNVLATIRHNWHSTIPESAQWKKGEVAIEFAVKKDGSVAGMKLVTSSGDVTLDRAAWAGIVASAPFPTLPEEFKGDYLALRLHFLYNPTPSEVAASAAARAHPGPQLVPDSSPKPDLLQFPKAPFSVRSNPSNEPRSKNPLVHALLIAHFAESMAPEYPERALKSKVEGKVRLIVNIRQDGSVEDMSVPQGDPLLADASVRAVQKWRFYPALKNGHAVADIVQMNVYFQLDGEKVKIEVVPAEAATTSLVR
jgi:TonB family protein